MKQQMLRRCSKLSRPLIYFFVQDRDFVDINNNYEITKHTSFTYCKSLLLKMNYSIITQTTSTLILVYSYASGYAQMGVSNDSSLSCRLSGWFLSALKYCYDYTFHRVHIILFGFIIIHFDIIQVLNITKLKICIFGT